MIDNTIENMLEVKLPTSDDFLKIVETLTRIGVVSRDNTLTQTCHILHKRGKYFITHFKELFELDGNGRSQLTNEDYERRNAIAKLLQDWNLCEIVEPERYQNRTLGRVTIVSFSDKEKYNLKQNYTIGKRREG